MTVLSEINKITYIGSLAQTLYPIPFEYVNTDNIKVSVYTSNDEFVEDWTFSTQYVIEGGNVKVLPGYEIDDTKKLLVLRSLDIVQDNKYREGGDFPAKSTELSFDKLTMIAQQHQEVLDRCVKVEVVGKQTPQELLDEVYSKLDSATEIAGDAINAANQAQTAADNATAAVNSAEQTLVQTQAYVDSAKVDINNTKNTAINTINSTVSTAKADIANTVVSAKADITNTADNATGEITSTVTQAKADINTAIDEATMNISDTVDTGISSITNVKDSAINTINTSVSDAKSDIDDKILVATNEITTIKNEAVTTATEAKNLSEQAIVDINNAKTTAESNIDDKVLSANNTIDSKVNGAKSDITDSVNAAKDNISNAVSTAELEITGVKNEAINTINTSVSTAESNISTIVSDAEGSITNIAVTEANKAIANASKEATDTATANLNNYVDGTVKPSLHTYVDQAQADANSAATSMEQAALSATAASNYASNASADADNAAESAALASADAGSAARSAEIAQQIKDSLGNVYVYKGSVNSYSNLPSGASVGDVYNVVSNGKNYAWTGSEWDDLGGTVDLSEYQKTADADSKYATQTSLNSLSSTVSSNSSNITSLQNNKQDTITGAASTITSSNLTSSRALVSNGSGKVAVSDVTSTELGYLDGVTSSIQTQLNTKQTTENLSQTIDASTTKYPSNKAVKDALANVSGVGNIGDIKYTARTDTPEGGAWCDGAEYTQAAFPDLYQMLVSDKLQSTTYTDFNNQVSTNGYCSLFALNTATTSFKVPSLPDKYVIGLEDEIPVKGNGMTLGLTNGETLGGITSANIAVSSGNPFYKDIYGTNIGTAGSTAPTPNKSLGVTTDSTKSGIIADCSNASKVVTLKAYVVLYTSAAEASVAQASEFMTALGGKANVDLSNVSSNIDYVVESYKNGANWYRVYKSGWIEQGGLVDNGTAQMSWNKVVNLLKPLSTNYTLVVSDIDSSNNDARPCSAKLLTETSFKIISSFLWGRDNQSRYACWYACGQGA